MAAKCSNCGCGSDHNCGTDNLSEAEIEKLKEQKKAHSRKFSVKYRIKLDQLNCSCQEFIDRVKAYAGIVDEVEFTETELIIAYDDRLITPAEISELVN